MALDGFVMCPACDRRSTQAAWRDNLNTCPLCGAHQPISAGDRLDALLDKGSMIEIGDVVTGGDPLAFPGYMKKLEAQREKTGMDEALLAVTGTIEGRPCVAAVLDGAFFMGDPQTVADKLRRVSDQLGGVDRISIQMTNPRLAHDDLLRGIELLGTEVAPLVADA